MPASPIKPKPIENIRLSYSSPQCVDGSRFACLSALSKRAHDAGLGYTIPGSKVPVCRRRAGYFLINPMVSGSILPTVSAHSNQSSVVGSKSIDQKRRRRAGSISVTW